MFPLEKLFQKSELIPVIIQEQETKNILMLGFTNLEAVELTLKTGTAISATTTGRKPLNILFTTSTWRN